MRSMTAAPRLPACLPHPAARVHNTLASWRGAWPERTPFLSSGELWYDGHAAVQSIMPTSEGTTLAVGRIVPELHG